MTLHELRDKLLTISPNVYHYHAHQQPDSYIVWAEYGDKRLSADSEFEEKAFRVQVDFFTKTEFDSKVAQIDTLLDRDDISYEYLVDHEEDTGYIHHIWDCEVV